MADLKISQLTGATTPLAGTEVLPIVQSGATVKVSVDNLTTGKPVNGTQFTASTGNFIVGNAGKGIDFSVNTHAAGMTSELLTWYEEGTWTPSLIFSTLGDLSVTYNVRLGYYTRVGRQVNVVASIETSAFTYTTASGTFRVSGLPFTSTNVTSLNIVGSVAMSGWTKICNFIVPQILPNVSVISFLTSTSGAGTAVLTATDVPSATNQIIRLNITYLV